MAAPPAPEPHSGTTAQRVDFDASVAFLITSLANKLNNRASRQLKRRLGVGLMEWRAMVLLAVEGEASPGRIAQVAGVDKSVVSRAVTSLERRGLLRVSADSQPGRQTRLTLTAAGLTLHDQGIGDMLAREAALLATFTPEERAAVIGLLKRLTANHARAGERET